MWRLAADLFALTAMAAISLVFCVQWAKKFKENYTNFYKKGTKFQETAFQGTAFQGTAFQSLLLSLVVLFGALVLAYLLHNCFKSYFAQFNITNNIIIFLWFFVLGITQLIWENYSMIKKWVALIIKKKLEKKLDDV